MFSYHQICKIKIKTANIIIKVLLHGKFDFFRRQKSTRKKSGATDDKNINI